MSFTVQRPPEDVPRRGGSIIPAAPEKKATPSSELAAPPVNVSKKKNRNLDIDAFYAQSAEHKSAVERAKQLACNRKQPLPEPKAIKVLAKQREPKAPDEQNREYATIVIQGSSGGKWKLVLPKSFAEHVPKVWQWTQQRYRVAQLIADGMPIVRITVAEGLLGPEIIYGWLYHPEFREHVDSLVLEFGYSSKRERVAGMSALMGRLYTKITDSLERIEITDKGLGGVINGFVNLARQIAQEKGELEEIQNVKVSGSVAMSGEVAVNGVVAHVNTTIDELMNSGDDEFRKQLSAELFSMGDKLLENAMAGNTIEAVAKILEEE